MESSSNKPLEIQIIEAEESLRIAMLNSDITTLDRLLAPELIFTNHLGRVLTKQDDLTAHQSETIQINDLNFSEQRIQLCGNIAIVSVRVSLSGSYAGIPSSDDFRFTRVWTLSSSGTWQVFAAHSSLIN